MGSDIPDIPADLAPQRWPQCELVFDTLPLALMVLTDSGLIVACNPGFRRLVGYSTAELVGRSLDLLLPEAKVLADFLDRLHGHLEPVEASDERITLRHRDGGSVTVSYRSLPIVDGDRGYRSFLVEIQDERAVADHLQKIRSLAKFSDENPFPVLRAALDGTLLYANPGSWLLLEHWGIEVGQTLPERLKTQIREVATQSDSAEIEEHIGFKTILLVITPVAETGYVNLFGLDVTRRRQVEQKLLLDAQVFESATEGVVITDAERRILDVNQAFTIITGYKRDEILGENINILQSGRHDEAFYQELWASVRERGSWQGEIWDRRKNNEVYPKWLSISAVTDGSGNIVRYIGLFSDISVMKQTEDQLYHMANYDSLTGLPNRRFFHERLDQTINEVRRLRDRMALMFVDLDGFKLINDNLGHLSGDQLLCVVANRLKECIRDSDMVARMGGDEFIIILPNLSGAQNAAIVAQKVLEHLSQTIALDRQDVFITASIGIAVFPDDATDASSLLGNADAALYQAKEQGKNTYRFFSKEMNTHAAERLSLQVKLRRALTGNELVVYYQPQINAVTRQLIGCEALVRWLPPGQDMIMPDQFIPLAEETGMITPLGELVLRQVCAQGLLWLKAGYAPLRIAVNISANHLRRPDFIDTITAIVKQSGFPATNLEFEITEGVLLDDSTETLEKLLNLKALGASLAIDDFGTKYSSLAYLHRLPIDRIKIDKSFVLDIQANGTGMEIPAAIIVMCRSLRLEVVAEGVERKDQADLLQREGCHIFQGNHFGHPVPAEELGAVLLSSTTAAIVDHQAIRKPEP